MDNTQISIVKGKLENGERITSMDAFQLGITRLSAIIYILRHEQGMNILTNNCEAINRYGHKTHFAEYVLKDGVVK